MSITDVCICGAPMDAHMSPNRRRRTCDQARRAVGYAPVDFATLLRLALVKHTAGKQAAIETVRPVGALRCWSVRLGGRIKGFTVHTKTLPEMYQLIDFYYAEKLRQRRLRKARAS